MTTLELIDKAISHCKKCRPDESGHGVTLALLNEIKEGVGSKDAEIERLTALLEAAKKDFDDSGKFLVGVIKPISEEAARVVGYYFEDNPPTE